MLSLSEIFQALGKKPKHKFGSHSKIGFYLALTLGYKFGQGMVCDLDSNSEMSVSWIIQHVIETPDWQKRILQTD